MKKTVLRYGIYAGIAELVIFFAIWLIIYFTKIDHKAQGIIGYVNIICPMIFVYFGVRYYRDVVKNGALSFMGALKVGLLIIIIPTLSFALIETVYVEYIDPKFYANIMLYDVEQYRKTLSADQFDLKLKDMQQQIVALKNPVFNFMGMVFEIGAVGMIVALLSAIFLMRTPKQAVAASA